MSSRKVQFWKDVQAAKLMVKQAGEEADLRRDEFNARPQRSPDWIYDPTRSSNPSDPRTAAMQYWEDERVLRVEWGDNGTPYLYYEVTKAEVRRLDPSKNGVQSPGRFINRVLNAHPYGPE